MRLPFRYVRDQMGKTKKSLSTRGGGEEAPRKTAHLTLYCAFQVVLPCHFVLCILFIQKLRGKDSSWFFPLSQLFYQLSTPQNKFLLNLTLQGGLLSRQFRVEYWKRGRLAWSRPYSSHCQYVGHLQDQPHSSKVALSNCNGLVRSRRLVSFTSDAPTVFLAINTTVMPNFSPQRHKWSHIRHIFSPSASRLRSSGATVPCREIQTIYLARCLQPPTKLISCAKQMLCWIFRLFGKIH